MQTAVLLLSSAIFITGYLAIAPEHTLKVSKTAVALITGTLLWMLVALHQPANTISDALTHAGAEVFSIVVFLLAAMSLVEILVHYRFFDLIRGKLFALNLGDHKQFLVSGLLSFVLSAVIAKLTTTIKMIQISRKFFKGNNLLVVGAGIVINALADALSYLTWQSHLPNTGRGNQCSNQIGGNKFYTINLSMHLNYIQHTGSPVNDAGTATKCQEEILQLKCIIKKFQCRN